MSRIAFALSVGVLLGGALLLPAAPDDKAAKAPKPPLAASNPNAYVLGATPQVVYRDSKGLVHQLYRPPKSTWSHANLTAVAKAPTADGEPIGYVQNETQHVVYRGSTGLVHELYRLPKGTWS